MKRLILTSFLAVLVSLAVFAQGNTSIKLQEKAILVELFDGIQLTSRNDVKWKPNFYDKKKGFVSSDNFVYTKLDTVFYYQENNVNKAALVFATYIYENYTQNQKTDGHWVAPYISIAVYNFDPTNKKWEVEKFEKYYDFHGLWGAIHPISLEKIGKNRHALVFSGGYTHMGENNFQDIYFDLYHFKNIFTVQTAHDNTGMGLDAEDTYEITRRVNFQENKNEYYTIVVKTTENNKTTNQTYYFDELQKYFVKVN